jgi:hypothetical protein
MHRSVLMAAPLALFASGCTKTIKAAGAAKVVTNVVFSQTKFRPTDVKCPSGKDAKVGVTFDCHFTGPDGKYVAHMRVRSVKGQRVVFGVQTEPIGR